MVILYKFAKKNLALDLYSLLSGFQVIERPWLLVTDRQTDGRQRKNKSPNPN